MASNGPSVSTKELSSNTTDNVLTQILSEVKSLRQEYEVISRKVERIDSIHSALFYTGDCGSSLPRRMMSEYPGSPSSVSFDLSYSHSKSPSMFLFYFILFTFFLKFG
ncbi:hypothetical protein HMI56_000967 [Coelomomyces lativittatus]|nr:hypothetical protein HMI56_000967 [Coelomomyces lativittatus]